MNALVGDFGTCKSIFERRRQRKLESVVGAGLSRDDQRNQLRYRGVNPLLQVMSDQESLHRWIELTPMSNKVERDVPGAFISKGDCANQETTMPKRTRRGRRVPPEKLTLLARSTRAFTLIEMVVALAVTAVIGYFFISIGRDFVRAWDNFGDAVSRETEARAALDLIAKDFESAYFREGSDHMLAVDVRNNGNVSADWEAGPAERPTSSGFDAANHEYGWAGCWVRLFTSTPSLNAVGYQIIRSTIRDNVGAPRYMLYRNTTLTRDVISNIETGFADALDLTGSNSLYDVSGGVVNPTRSNILAVNVVDFGVRLYIYEPNPTSDPSDVDAPEGLRLIFPADGSSRLQNPIPNNGQHRSSTFVGTTYSDRYPDVVEVFMRILDENGAEALSAMEESGSNAQWEEIVANNSKLYRRYIVVRGRSGL